MASGGVRFDFTSEDNFTQGENREVRIPIEDADGDPVGSFSGWEFRWLLFTALKDNRDAIDTDAVIDVENASITASAPNVDIPVDIAFGTSPRTYWYELWRVDTGNRNRLAWGQFPIVD